MSTTQIPYGCYIARTGARNGEPELAAEARLIWEREWAEDEPVRKVHDNEDGGPDAGDGVFISQGDDGTITRRLVLRGMPNEVGPYVAPERETAWATLMRSDDE